MFAFVSVLIQFAIGLFLAITLNKPGLKLRRTQRALLVLPFAMPAFLVGPRLAGAAERRVRDRQPDAPHTSIPWLFDPTWAKVSCILVNVWLGFPYCFLVCTGALQAVPDGADRGGTRRRRRRSRSSAR